MSYTDGSKNDKKEKKKETYGKKEWNKIKKKKDTRKFPFKRAVVYSIL